MEKSPCCTVFPQWGAADEEIRVLSTENQELSNPLFLKPGIEKKSETELTAGVLRMKKD